MQIEELFDSSRSSRNIYRTIEKVITYAADQEERLKAEVSEYVVTDHMEEQFEELLSKMQLAMGQGGQTEVGVWVSGYYGSGKSSLTKYLGLALDSSVVIDGEPFLRHLQDRMSSPRTKALLNAISARFPAAIVFLDLASEQVAGATMEDVSTVLYYKVLQKAGYSRNLKVAALERRLQKDGKFAAFAARVEEEGGIPWEEAQNDPLVIDSLVPELAHEFLPGLFRTETSFNTESADYIVLENERVEEMINIVREHSGKEHVIFIVDELGQYVGSRANLITNVDGLAKNIKNIGDGKVWLIATAQQTLTEDDPRAAINSPELFKLEARFPIQVDLEARDIKEICIRRLLGKSPDGASALAALYRNQGERLRYNIKLEDARFYESDFNQETFVNLYPFLPAHFDILLQLLGILARAGGIGLRSAIKVIQDILIDRIDDQPALAKQPVGTLVTTVTIYDALEKEIRNSKKHLSSHAGVGKVQIQFPDSPIHQAVAKTVAVLQILENIPITKQNIAALLHANVEEGSQSEAVEKAIEDLVNHPLVPFGEKEGGLAFFSEKLNTIDQERLQVPARTVETRRIQNDILRSLFSPLPSTRLHGSLSVTSGLKSVMGGSMATSLAGDRETIQTLVEFVAPADYETARNRCVDESTQRSAANTIYLLGRTDPTIQEMISEIYRCQEVARRYRNDPDSEVREYCTSLTDRADRLGQEVERKLEQSLRQGSFIFRGQTVAVDTLAPSLQDAARKHLAGVAEQIFDRYDEAPVRAETALAERFLKTGNLRAITAAIDPLNLVQMRAGTPRINSEHTALVSIRDYLSLHGSVDGKRLTDHFTAAPFGWSQDTLRYLVAALYVGSEIKLRISGRDVTTVGQQAIDALRTNNSFRTVGVSLREGDQPSTEVRARAATRLTELSGEQVMPLEDNISKAAVRLFTRLQHEYGGLPGRLEYLGLPGALTMRQLNQTMADMLLDDASDAARLIGAEESPLYTGLLQANKVTRALADGLQATVEDLQRHCGELATLPTTGTAGRLRQELAEELEQVSQCMARDDFYNYATDLSTLLRNLRARIRDTVNEMAGELAVNVRSARETIQQLADWQELEQPEREHVLNQIDALVIETAADIDGLQTLISHSYNVTTVVDNQTRHVRRLSDERRRQRLIEEQNNARAAQKPSATKDPNGEPYVAKPVRLRRKIVIPATIGTSAELDRVIRELQQVKAELELHNDIDITIGLS